MERLLRVKWLRWFLFAIAVTLVGTVTFATAYAATYSGWFTGYAMGNRYGQAGVEVRQGHFANHSPTYCPGDPAAYWSWGTRIDTPWIGMITGEGWPYARNTFYKYDGGDTSCSLGNYWVDIYFGRYRYPGQSCDCPGSPSPGDCYNANSNSCDVSKTFNRTWKTYSGP